jgi:hypothetical protein
MTIVVTRTDIHFFWRTLLLGPLVHGLLKGKRLVQKLEQLGVDVRRQG